MWNIRDNNNRTRVTIQPADSTDADDIQNIDFNSDAVVGDTKAVKAKEVGDLAAKNVKINLERKLKQDRKKDTVYWKT